MNRLFSILGIFIFLIVTGCKEENDMPDIMNEEEVICPSQDSFHITGLLNGKVWKTKTHSFIRRFNNGIFEVVLSGNDRLLDEQNSTNGKGLSIITESKIHPKMTPINANFEFLYGDVGGVPYEIHEGDSIRNWVEISYIDDDNQIVEGAFEFFLKKKVEDKIVRPVSEPDSIEILDGCFGLAREN